MKNWTHALRHYANQHSCFNYSSILQVVRSVNVVVEQSLISLFSQKSHRNFSEAMWLKWWVHWWWIRVWVLDVLQLEPSGLHRRKLKCIFWKCIHSVIHMLHTTHTDERRSSLLNVHTCLCNFRNLSVVGGEDVCNEMVKEDVLTSLVALFKQVFLRRALKSNYCINAISKWCKFFVLNFLIP